MSPPLSLSLCLAEAKARAQVHYEGTHHPAEKGLSMAASHDGHHLYFPCGNSLKVYETHWGRHVGTLKGHFAAVNCAAVATRTSELYTCVPAPF